LLSETDFRGKGSRPKTGMGEELGIFRGRAQHSAIKKKEYFRQQKEGLREKEDFPRQIRGYRSKAKPTRGGAKGGTA